MAKLPLINAIKLIKILEKIGFKATRQEGSHVFLRHEDGMRMAGQQLFQIIKEKKLTEDC